MESIQSLAPGARILVRDAEWIIKKVDKTSTGGQKLTVTGLSEIVRDREWVFLTEVSKGFKEKIEILDPINTEIVSDPSSGYLHSRLYLHSALHSTPPTHNEITIGRDAAMDQLPFQLVPAQLALDKPRQRILIADAVGLGKTLEAGVLMSELINRGRGRRILVLTVKSMMTQFQMELWNRFTIGLTRLDSQGLQRVRARIPANYNPFHYYDRTIISIDTLKNDGQYRPWLENAYWDIIVIDEAHNVAIRGGNPSKRARLANLLATRSDSLIMLSATPHDGKSESFASLMKMLDPTAIADEADYQPEDIRGLYVRRFQSNLEDELGDHFQERRVETVQPEATDVEEEAYAELKNLQFQRIDSRKTGSMLFKTLLEKSLFSSPAACLKTIQKRIGKLEKLEDEEWQGDIAELRRFETAVARIDAENFSKFNRLVQFIQKSGFKGKERDDRIVIFTERIETLHFLKEYLPPRLRLKDKNVAILHGGLGDQDQQTIVSEFGKASSDLRLLLASDVASEGINLHYFCNRLIHFDVPWSLMVFQQRNGRVDRYGQTRQPHILYFQTTSNNEAIKGDARILEILIAKDEQARKNIGDPSIFMNVFNVEDEEAFVARALESQQSVEEFEASLNIIDLFGDDCDMYNAPEDLPLALHKPLPYLFDGLFDYVVTSLEKSTGPKKFDLDVDEKGDSLILTLTDELKRRFSQLPREIWRDDGRLGLSPDTNFINQEIKAAREREKGQSPYPQYHYLWPLHPIIPWIHDKNQSLFGRHQAPFIEVPVLEANEYIFLISGIIPNRRGQSLVQEWPAIHFRNGELVEILEIQKLFQRVNLA